MIRAGKLVVVADAQTDLDGRRKSDASERVMWCRAKLAGYKVPSEIRLMESLPRNPTGKVMRRELKKIV